LKKNYGKILVRKMWKRLLKNQVLKGTIQNYTFERKIRRMDKGNNTMVTYDYEDRGKDSDIELDWNTVIVEWSMSVEEYDDGLELNAPQVRKVIVGIDFIEDIGEEVETLAENLELETTENITVEELDRVVMGSVIMPEADIEIGQKDGKFYIKSVNISW
tara:strand:+ start:1620 stop:2099 length:480 start_codon:yes stop_codon:yes gene_type:complete